MTLPLPPTIAPLFKVTALCPTEAPGPYQPTLNRMSVSAFKFSVPPLTFRLPRVVSHWFMINQRSVAEATLTLPPAKMLSVPMPLPATARVRSSSELRTPWTTFIVPAPETPAFWPS